MRAKLEEIPVMKRLGVLITVAPVAAPDAGAIEAQYEWRQFPSR